MIKKKIYKPLLFCLIILSISNLSFSFRKNKLKNINIKNRGLELQYLDSEASPKQDFYEYVNGLWLKETKIPTDLTSWGNFNELQVDNEKILHNIVLDAISKDKLKKNSDEKKAITLYQLGMDEEKIEEKGITPINHLFERVENAKNISEIISTLAFLQKSGINSFLNTYAYIDEKNTKKMALYIGTSGISLPDRDYYLDKKYEKIKNKYEQHLESMFSLMGISTKESKNKARSIIKTETYLAQNMLSKVELRNPNITYNKYEYKDLEKLSPKINLVEYVNNLGYKNINSAIVKQPKYTKALSTLLKEDNLEELKHYLKWKILTSSAPYLPLKYRQENWDFYSRILLGSEKMKDRWKSVLGTVNESVGFALGKIYVKKQFPKEAKQIASVMVKNIKASFKNRIQNLDWMSDDTKTKAMDKLNTFVVKIGYPDKWENYKGLDIKDTDSFIGALMKSSQYELKRNIKSLTKEVDRKKWEMTPQTVNAYYNPVLNEIVFPAAILQPPFFNPKSDDAVNYGAIGAVIGHEITHGFDDQGRNYDAKGNLNNWWTEEDAEKFKKKTDELVNQFDQYTVLDNQPVNGKLTLGENIADLGGLTVAYDALMKANKNKGNIDGFSPSQRFFMSWSTVWRIKYRDEALKNRLITDVHSPGMIRGFAPLTNLEAFMKAFHIDKGDKMFRAKDKRVRIW